MNNQSPWVNALTFAGIAIDRFSLHFCIASFSRLSNCNRHQTLYRVALTYKIILVYHFFSKTRLIVQSCAASAVTHENIIN